MTCIYFVYPKLINDPVTLGNKKPLKTLVTKKPKTGDPKSLFKEIYVVNIEIDTLEKKWRDKIKETAGLDEDGKEFVDKMNVVTSILREIEDLKVKKENLLKELK